MAGTTTGAKVHHNPLYQQSTLSVLPFALVAPLLGAAEGALVDFLDMAKVRTTGGAVAGGNNRMSEFATVQGRVAEATGSLGASHLMILQALKNALAAADAGKQSDLELRLRNRLSQSFSVRLVVRQSTHCFKPQVGREF